jgi:hypothetical protein
MIYDSFYADTWFSRFTYSESTNHYIPKMVVDESIKKFLKILKKKFAHTKQN